MKRILALLLALTMVFALCACGTTKENTQKTDNKNEQGHYDELAVEDVSLEFDAKRNAYKIDAKVRNINYPVFEGLNIAGVSISYRFLDSAGDGLPSNTSAISGYEKLPKGQAGWKSGTGAYFIDREVVDAATSIVFDGYEMYSTHNAQGYAEHVYGIITNPVIFPIDEIVHNRP